MLQAKKKPPKRCGFEWKAYSHGGHNQDNRKPSWFHPKDRILGIQSRCSRAGSPFSPATTTRSNLGFELSPRVRLSKIVTPPRSEARTWTSFSLMGLEYVCRAIITFMEDVPAAMPFFVVQRYQLSRSYICTVGGVANFELACPGI